MSAVSRASGLTRSRPCGPPTGRGSADAQYVGLGIVTVDGSSPLVMLTEANAPSWQPVAAPLLPAPSFAVSPSP